jgi:hypothetical protein
MDDLTPDALVRAGRSAFRPEASDRERVLQSLTRTLGESALLDGPQHGGLAKRAFGPRFSLQAKLLGGLGALAIGAALVVAPRLWTKTTPASGPAPVPSSIILAAQPEPLPISPTEQDETSVQPAAASVPDAPRPSPRSSKARSPSDSLAEEVGLVSKAEQQLYAGHADDALKILGEHERRFPNGALAEQRMAARVQSLCTLGRIAEARANLTRLARAYPRSPHLDRARRFCGIETP